MQDQIKKDEILLTQSELNNIYNLITILIHHTRWNYENKNFTMNGKTIVFKDQNEFNKAKYLRDKISNLVITDDELPF